jgi:hypothetical protein
VSQEPGEIVQEAPPSRRGDSVFGDLLSRLDSRPGVRGRQFERICAWYLDNAPEYRRRFRKVWLWGEWPGAWAGPNQCGRVEPCTGLATGLGSSPTRCRSWSWPMRSTCSMRARTIGVLAALALFGAVPAAEAPAQSGPLTAHASCVHARIVHKRKCIARGQYCKHTRRANRDYHRYGFHCGKRDRRGRFHLVYYKRRP